MREFENCWGKCGLFSQITVVRIPLIHPTGHAYVVMYVVDYGQLRAYIVAGVECCCCCFTFA